MNPILQLIETATKGKTYRSHRFSYDAEMRVPSLAYDDQPLDFTLEKELGETDQSIQKTRGLTAFAKKLEEEEPLFRYFLDGSRRVYKIDDIEFSKRIFPIVGGQVAVACCERADKRSFKKAILENELVMALPSYAAAEGGAHEDLFFKNLVGQVNNLEKMKRRGATLADILTYESGRNESGEREEYLNRGIAKIQDRMIELEKKVVNDLARQNRLTVDRYLLKDGSLQYQQVRTGDFREIGRFRANFRRVVGISKTFNPEFSKDKRGRSNAAAIAELPLFHRTPAAMYTNSHLGDVKYSIWYLRLREAGHSESRFSGVVKVEKILMSGEENENGLESGEIDLISANLINERNPVCYGTDQRWANHLYPIYLTEAFLKSQFLSELHFLNLF